MLADIGIIFDVVINIGFVQFTTENIFVCIFFFRNTAHNQNKLDDMR